MTISASHSLHANRGAAPRAWRWTVDSYDRAASLGIFAGRRVELIEGRVFDMPAQHEPHVAAVVRCDRALEVAFGAGGYAIRRQAPVQFSKTSAPEPDIAVVPGSAEDYLRRGAPTSALLVIEVSDATLAFDRSVKLALYARHGIQDYWILNLVDWWLEVYRQPLRDRSAKRGYRYGQTTQVDADGTIAPLAKPDAFIRVADLLPPFRPA
jgi:Uma2 family endonuclease